MKNTILLSLISLIALSSSSFAMDEAPLEDEDRKHAQAIRYPFQLYMESTNTEEYAVNSVLNFDCGPENYTAHPAYTRGKNFYLSEKSTRKKNCPHKVIHVTKRELTDISHLPLLFDFGTACLRSGRTASEQYLIAIADFYILRSS